MNGQAEGSWPGTDDRTLDDDIDSARREREKNGGDLSFLALILLPSCSFVFYFHRGFAIATTFYFDMFARSGVSCVPGNAKLTTRHLAKRLSYLPRYHSDQSFPMLRS